MAKNSKTLKKFERVERTSVPARRHGKHDGIVSHILSDLKVLADGEALKIPLDELTDTKANVRSALNRASRNLGLKVSTAADEDHLYVWNGNSGD